MRAKVDLHLRSNALAGHRNLGVVAVEHQGPRLAPNQDIAWQAGGRQVKAHVTSIQQRGDHLPHVYAEVVH